MFKFVIIDSTQRKNRSLDFNVDSSFFSFIFFWISKRKKKSKTNFFTNWRTEFLDRCVIDFHWSSRFLFFHWSTLKHVEICTRPNAREYRVSVVQFDWFEIFQTKLQRRDWKFRLLETNDRWFHLWFSDGNGRFLSSDYYITSSQYRRSFVFNLCFDWYFLFFFLKFQPSWYRTIEDMLENAIEKYEIDEVKQLGKDAVRNVSKMFLSTVIIIFIWLVFVFIWNQF